MQTQLEFESVSEAERKFREFHAKNPQVYRELVKLAREGKAAGRRKIGMKMIWEIVRWKTWLSTTDEQFKLPNNHHSRYARLVMDQEPDLEGIFETRRLSS